MNQSQTMTSFTVTHGPLDAELLVRMATLYNDFNPIHYDGRAAEAIGMPAVVVPGSLAYAFALADVAKHLGSDGSSPHELRSISMRMRAATFVDETIEMSYEEREPGTWEFVCNAQPGPDARRVASGVLVWGRDAGAQR